MYAVGALQPALGAVLGLVDGDVLGLVDGDVLGLVEGDVLGLVEGDVDGDVLGLVEGDVLGGDVGAFVLPAAGTETPPLQAAIARTASAPTTEKTPRPKVVIRERILTGW